ncbi:MAG: hypothetical protein Q7J05_01910 [Paludibacter sp.]|nr:hypothetical protein [Paludibacter sp.]
MKIKNCFVALATSLLFFWGCTEDQSELNLSSIDQFVTISGTVVYNTGVDTTSTDYTMEIMKPAIGRKVFVEVGYANYKAGAVGNKIFETVIDSTGNFSVEIPTISTGITANIRMEEFSAYFSEYVKMEDGKPVFKTRLRRFETALPPLVGLKPGAFSYPTHVTYNSVVIDLEGYNEKITLTGNVQLAFESSFRTGAYKPAASGTVELEIVYDPLGTPMVLTFGTTADASGNYSVTVPLKSYKAGFRINKVSVLGIGQNAYSHYNKPGESISLTGAYQTTLAAGFPVTLTNILENIPHSLGKQYLKFTPNFNNGLPAQNAPESWSDNLAGWENYDGYNEQVTLTGTYNLANETAFAVGSYNTAVRTIKVNVVYGTKPTKVVLAATQADGSFSIDLPAQKTTDTYAVTVLAPEETEFIHYKSATETATIRGTYGIYRNIRKDAPQWFELGDYYYKFTPTTAPATWQANLAGWVKIKDHNLTATVSGKVYLAKESAFAAGSYEAAKGRVIAISAGGNIYEAAVGADGTLNIAVPIQNNGDELAVTLNTTTITGIKDFTHFTNGGTTDTRILTGSFTATQLKPATSKWNELGDVYFTFTPASAPATWQVDLAGWKVRLDHNASSNIRGTLKLPVETAFRSGSYVGAAYQIVKLSSNGFTLVGATDANGEFTIPVPLKYADEEPATTWDASMNIISTTSFAHFRKPANSTTEILSGNYTVKLTDVPLGSAWNRLGTRYYDFSPSGSPTNWSANLPGWVVVPNSSANITVKGKVKQAVQVKDGSNWSPSWANCPNRMVSVGLSGTNYAVVTNAAGDFTFNLPVTTVPASYNITINPANDLADVAFIHHPNIATDDAITIYGKFVSAANIAARVTNKDASTNLYEVAESAKMSFNPTVVPAGWGNYSWTAIIANEQ